MKNNRPIIILLVAVLCLAALCGCEDKTAEKNRLMDIYIVGIGALNQISMDKTCNRPYIGVISSELNGNVFTTTYSGCSVQVDGEWVSGIDAIDRLTEMDYPNSYPSDMFTEMSFTYKGKHHTLLSEIYYRTSISDKEELRWVVDGISLL